MEATNLLTFPDELLLAIMGFADRVGILHLTHANRRLRELALSSSGLWSTLDNATQCEEEVQACLIRSNKHDLYIHSTCVAPDTPESLQPKTPFNAFMQLLYPHANRWATYSLNITGPTSEDDDNYSFLDMDNEWDEYPQEISEDIFSANAGVKLSLPRLQSVGISGARTITDAPFGAWHAPNIRSLSFQNTSDIWLSYDMLGSLTQAFFAFDAHPRYGFEMQPFHGRLAYALLALPALETLHLRFTDCNVSEWEEEEVEDIPSSLIVTLPKLKQLRITLIHGGNLNSTEDLNDLAPLARLIRAMNLPALTHLELDVAVPSVCVPIWTRALLPADASTRWPNLSHVRFREQTLFRSCKECACGHCCVLPTRGNWCGQDGESGPLSIRGRSGYAAISNILRGGCCAMLLIGSRLPHVQNIYAEVPCAPPVSCLLDMFALYDQASSSQPPSPSFGKHLLALTESANTVIDPHITPPLPTETKPDSDSAKVTPAWDALPGPVPRIRPFARLRALQLAYGEERCTEHCPASVSYPVEWHAATAAQLNLTSMSSNEGEGEGAEVATSLVLSEMLGRGNLLPPACGHACGACAFREAVAERTGADVQLVTRRCEFVKFR